MAPHPDILSSRPEGFSLRDVSVRLVRSHERERWDRLCDEHHYLGFRRFVSKGLRYVFEYRGPCEEHRGRWLGIAGWHAAAFKCRPRDRFIGWPQERQFKRLHLIANNGRFLVLTEPGVIPNLATWALAAMCRRLPRDTREHWGHEVLMAESFVSPSRFSGTMYRAANWTMLGLTKGFARSNGGYTAPHDEKKEMWVHLLRRDAREIMNRPGDLAPVHRRHDPDGDAVLPEPSSIFQHLLKVKDYRRAQGRKHSVATVLTVYLLARLSNIHGVVPTAEFAANLTQDQLRRIGAWKNPATGRYESVSKSTIHRVITRIDTQELEALQRRLSSNRRHVGAALAADGKRIRGANRHGAMHHETVSLVEHATGLPIGSIACNEEGGEAAAVADLIETVPIAGHVVTLDALHTNRNTARRLVDMHGAHYLLRVKANAAETFRMLEDIDWECEEARTCHTIDKGHGRLEERRLDALTPLPRTFNWPHLKQIYRVVRYREELGRHKPGQGATTVSHGLASVPESEASARQLLEWDRGHWSIENRNHWIRDTQMREDASTIRTGHAPDNVAVLNNIALAIIFTRSDMGVAKTQRHFAMNRAEAIQMVLELF